MINTEPSDTKELLELFKSIVDIKEGIAFLNKQISSFNQLFRVLEKGSELSGENPKYKFEEIRPELLNICQKILSNAGQRKLNDLEVFNIPEFMSHCSKIYPSILNTMCEDVLIPRLAKVESVYWEKSIRVLLEHMIFIIENEGLRREYLSKLGEAFKVNVESLLSLEHPEDTEMLAWRRNQEILKTIASQIDRISELVNPETETKGPIMNLMQSLNKLISDGVMGPVIQNDYDPYKDVTFQDIMNQGYIMETNRDKRRKE